MRSASDLLSDTGLLAPREADALAEAGLRRVEDLLSHLPRRHEDRRRFDAFPFQPGEGPVCLRGTVVDATMRRGAPGRRFFEAVVMDGGSGVFGSGKVTCRWFNMPFMQKWVAAGHEVILYGRVKDGRGRLLLDHPEIEVIREEGPPEESIHLDRVVPIYRNLPGLSQRRLRELIHRLLAESDPATLTAPFEPRPDWPRAVRLHEAHFPESLESALEARRSFALDEFFLLQLRVLRRRRAAREVGGRSHGGGTSLLKRFHASLPFELTGAQKRVIHEIVADLRAPRPMHRLLQGDVGAGKTFVAMAAMLLAVESGCQAALMAPTQILAEQHYRSFLQWLGPLGLRLSLRTGSRAEENHLPLEGEPQIVIGTHALLHGGVTFHDLGLVVIDEQHRFGVEQRARLVGQGRSPDLLVMTATPIPRTLTLTVYGDLDVSLLDERPPGRGRVITAVRVAPKQTEVTKFVKSLLAEGRQAYLIYPLVEEGEGAKAESAIEAHAKWSKRLAGFEVGLLHGRMPGEEKERVMRRFREGEIHALVATSVIEVGVDVPNASLMLVHHAERFGLAQIHQLRGRIGRGGHKGYCVLLTDGRSEEGLEKLRVLEKATDGFAIAEEDLRLRGPGDLLGTAQSGLGALRFPEFLADATLLQEARQLAEQVLREDPDLDGPHQALRPLLARGDENATEGAD